MSEPPQSERLIIEQLVRIGEAVADNAYALLDDAAFLAGDGRVLRAFFLATIAAEEFTKYLMCREELNAWSGTLTAAELDRKLSDTRLMPHAKRRERLLEYFRALVPETPLPPGFESIADLVKEEQTARNRALYVSVNPSGGVAVPEGVNPHDAAHYVLSMGQMITTLKPTVRRGLDTAAEAARSVGLSDDVGSSDDSPSS